MADKKLIIRRAGRSEVVNTLIRLRAVIQQKYAEALAQTDMASADFMNMLLEYALDNIEFSDEIPIAVDTGEGCTGCPCSRCRGGMKNAR